MNKKLLSILLTLPMVGIQMHADSQVSLGDASAHVEDTLFTAKTDAQTIDSKLSTLSDLKAELINCENEAQDAIERTKELLTSHPARQAAQKYHDFVRNSLNETQTMYKKLAASVQDTKNLINSASDKHKMNNQAAFKMSDTYNKALQQVRNPKENLIIK